MKRNQTGYLHVRAYCSVCGNLLSQTQPFSKRKLLEIWDPLVLGAVKMPCSTCGHKFPNFHIDLKVYNSKVAHEYLPSHYIKNKNKQTDDLISSAFDRFTKLEIASKLSQEANKSDSIPDSTTPSESESLEDKFNRIVKMRKECYG